jgi:hypothetical protein
VRRFALFLSSIILITAARASAADDVVTRAMTLYEKRHYDEAASMLRTESTSIEQGKKGTANLALGMIYFKNAVLHRELYQAAVAASQDYLKNLSAAQGKAEPFRRSLLRRSSGRVGQTRCRNHVSGKILGKEGCRAALPGDR